MTAIKYVTQEQLKEKTGINCYGYAFHDDNEIWIRDDLPENLSNEVKRHELEHIGKGESGPFWPAVAIAAASVASSVLGDKAAKRSAQAAKDTAAMQVEESRRQFDTTRADTLPYRQAGEEALSRISSLMMGGGSIDPNSIPGYNFRRQEGETGLERAINARGMRLSGRALKDLMKYNSDYASGEYDKGMAKLFTLAGFGPAGVNTSASAGANASGQINSAYGNQGNALANSYMMQSSSLNNAIQGGMQNYMTWNMYNNMMKGGTAGGTG